MEQQTETFSLESPLAVANVTNIGVGSSDWLDSDILDPENLPCFHCGKSADWLYMPSSDLEEAQRWACDEHVHRGCSCNEEPIDGDYENGDRSNWAQAVDSRGRKLPCCEWWNLTGY
jgi:hypothetical protein